MAEESALSHFANDQMTAVPARSHLCLRDLLSQLQLEAAGCLHWPWVVWRQKKLCQTQLPAAHVAGFTNCGVLFLAGSNIYIPDLHPLLRAFLTGNQKLLLFFTDFTALDSSAPPLTLPFLFQVEVPVPWGGLLGEKASEEAPPCFSCTVC